jgi:hypothetical protein
MQIDYHAIQRALLLNESIDLTAEQCLAKIYENLSSMQPKSVRERHLLKHSMNLVKEAKTKVRILSERVRTLEESKSEQIDE